MKRSGHTRTAAAMVAMAVFAWVPAASAQAVSGIVDVGADGAVRLYFPEPLPEHQPVYFQTPSRSGKPHCCVRVERNALEDIAEPPPEVMNAADVPIAAYRLKTPLKLKLEHGFSGLAMSARKVSANGAFALKGAGSQGVSRTRLCFGTEGMNVIGKSAKKVSSIYQSFGYGVDEAPKCNKKDLKDMNEASKQPQ